MGAILLRIVEVFRCGLLDLRDPDHIHSPLCLPHDGKHGPCSLC